MPRGPRPPGPRPRRPLRCCVRKRGAPAAAAGRCSWPGRRTRCAPDALEPNDTFASAAPINVGAVYQRLNFVPGPTGGADADFYSVRAKPGLCYLVQTGDLAPGLDTTILLWQAAATREGRALVAQNDDARPGTADLSSSARWCSRQDAVLVIELRNYGGAPPTDPRGKSYSLLAQIDPPPPVPTRPAAAGGPVAGAGPARDAAAGPPDAGPTSGSAPPPGTTLPAPPRTATPVPPPPTATPARAPAGPAIAPSGAALEAATAPPAAPATPIPIVVADLVAYLDLNQNEAPDPGEGITGLRGVVIDARTNAVTAEARSDANGHLRLRWPAAASVRLALPDLGWNQTVTASDLRADPGPPGGAGRWTAEVRVKAPALPGILP